MPVTGRRARGIVTIAAAIAVAGSLLTLVAASAAGWAAASVPASLSASVPASLSASVSGEPVFRVVAPASIGYGSTATVAARVTAGGTGMPGVAVALATRTSTTRPFVLVSTQTTGSSGAVAFHLAPRVNTQYQLTFSRDAGTAYWAYRPLPRWLLVRQVLTIAGGRHGAAPTDPVTLYGTVRPTELGRVVQLEYRTGTSWRLAAVTATVKWQRMPDGTSAAGYVLRFALPATQFRAYRAATAVNAAGASPELIAPLAIP
jgi:hypothetical protein